MVKYGLLGDGDFFCWLEENAYALISGNVEDFALEAIKRSCQIKRARGVENDELEHGDRALLKSWTYLLSRVGKP